MIFFVGTDPQTGAFTHLPDLEREINQFQDLVLLDMKENMNEGKTYEVIKWIYANRRAEFVMKSDEDSFVNVPALVASLNHIRRMYPKEYGM